MKKFKVSIEMTVAQCWIEDGFDLAEREDQIKEAFENMLPYADGHEVKVEITALTAHQYKGEKANI